MPAITSNPNIDVLSEQQPSIYYLDDGVAIFKVISTPEGSVVANAGSLAIQSDGRLYIKTGDNNSVGYVSPLNPGFIVATDYGIAGVGDETTKLQNAINAASLQGKILLLPPFTVTVSQVTIPVAGVQIWGQSGAGGSPISTIQSNGANSAIILFSNNFTRNVTISNVRILGTSAGSSQHGISFTATGSSLFFLEKLIIQNCGGDGIHIISGNFSYKLKDIYSSNHLENSFWIDAANSPCVELDNCYAGIVAASKYGYRIERGNVVLNNCNGIDSGQNWMLCGNDSIGVAQATLRHCNIESFTNQGILAGAGSDVQLFACTFVAPSIGVVQPLDMVQSTGRTTIDSLTTFVSGGATYNNAGNLPIKIFSRFVDCPSNINPVGATRITTFWNSDNARAEPLANSHQRFAALQVSGNFTETRATTNYIGSQNAGARTITLLDPASTECPIGRVIVVKDESGNAALNNITVNTTGGRNIDGAASATIATNYGSLRLVQRNSQYWTF